MAILLHRAQKKSAREKRTDRGETKAGIIF